MADVTAKIVNPPPVTPFTPVAIHIPVKLRTKLAAELDALKPGGKPNLELLAIGKKAVLDIAATFGPEVEGVEVKMEIGAGHAQQLMVIVFPHNL